MTFDNFTNINYIYNFNCQSNNINIFFENLLLFASFRNFKIEILGNVNKQPIYLLNRFISNNNKNILIIVGIHGEEQGAVWSIINFIRNTDLKILDKFNISILPLINPTGFLLNKRENYNDEKLNYQFGNYFQTEEERIIFNNIIRLRDLSKDFILSLHENIDSNGYYIYSVKNYNKKQEIFDKLNNEISKYYDIQNPNIESVKVKKGLILMKKDDQTIENYLYNLDNNNIIATEIPGSNNINTKIVVNNKIIDTCLDFLLDKK
jgi:hypothetical protein